MPPPRPTCRPASTATAARPNACWNRPKPQCARGRWNQAEELLWGSLTTATRGLALFHRAPADTDDQLRAFLNQFGDRQRDRYIRDAYDHLAALSDIAQRVRDRALRVDHLYITADDLAQAIERIIAAIPENHDHDHA